MKFIRFLFLFISLIAWSVGLLSYIPFLLMVPIDLVIYSEPRLLRWWDQKYDHAMAWWADLILDQ